jgi:hypothetical protein
MDGVFDKEPSGHAYLARSLRARCCALLQNSVTQRVRRYALAVECRACIGGQLDMLANDTLDLIAAETESMTSHRLRAISGLSSWTANG